MIAASGDEGPQAMGRGPGPAPLLVTGLPRSGTTWLARLLAESPATSMLGREPMNPRRGQWALGGEAPTWVRWTQATPRARVLLSRTYRGHAPRAYGRLGIGQWRAPLPWTRVVVKDPFALLSLPAVVEATGAVPVVIYRSAEATLSSYRRMGWRADVAEFRALGAPMPHDAEADDVSAMAGFWNWGYATMLADIERIPTAVVVSHAELTTGGGAARRLLFQHLRLGPVLDELRGPDHREQRGGRTHDNRLHNFDRTAAEVMQGVHQRVTREEHRILQAATADVAARLAQRRLPLTVLRGLDAPAAAPAEPVQGRGSQTPYA